MLEALCSLITSQDKINYDLFHMYPLDLKLEALEYFWDNIADTLVYYNPLGYYYYTILIFDTGIVCYTDSSVVNYVDRCQLIVNSNGKVIMPINNILSLKQYYIKYVTNYHKSLNPDEILKPQLH